MLFHTIYSKIKTPILLFVCAKVLLFVLLFFGRDLIEFGNDQYFTGTFLQHSYSSQEVAEKRKTGDVTFLLTPYDGQWYLNIADNGYNPHALTSEPRNIVFYPLYPALIALLGKFLGSMEWAGILISNLAQLGWMILLYLLVKREYSEQVAVISLLTLLLFPTSIVFSAVYTESLFLLLSIGSLFAARRGKWFLSGLVGFLAALTKIQGVILFPVLAVEWWLQRREEVPPSGWSLFGISLIPLGIFTYFGYLYGLTGSFFASLEAQKNFGMGRVTGFHPEHLWDQMTHLTSWHSFANSPIDAAMLVVFVLLLICSYKKIRFSYWMYSLLAILMPLSTWTLMSTTRYMMIVFPLFIWGATVMEKRKEVLVFFLVLLASFSALFSILFVNWRWIG